MAPTDIAMRPRGLSMGDEPTDALLNAASASASVPTAVSSRLFHALPQLSHWLHSTPDAAASDGPNGNRRRVASASMPPLASQTPTALRGAPNAEDVATLARLVEIRIDTTADAAPGVTLTPPGSPPVAGGISIDPTQRIEAGSAPPSRGTSPRSTTSSDDESTPDDLSLTEELRLMFRRCNHSLPFIVLFVLFFIYQHATGILVFIIGSVAIAGLDTRVKQQIALKEQASHLHLFGIVAMAMIDTVAICSLDGDPNPIRHLRRTLHSIGAAEHSGAALLLQVLWLVIVNDFIVRLWSIALKALVASIHSEVVFCGCRRGIPVSGSSASPSVPSDNDDDGETTRRKLSRSNIAFYRRKRKLYAIIELTSIFIRSLFACVPWCGYYQLCASKFMADFFTFVYIFGKALVLSSQGRRLLRLVKSFVTLGLEHATYVTREELAEAGSPDCSICYESMAVPVKLSCSHMFCEECVMEWFDRERSCPLCRAAIAAPSSRPEDEIKPPFLDGSTSLLPQLF